MVCCCPIPFPSEVVISHTYTITVSYALVPKNPFYDVDVYHAIHTASLDSVTSDIEGFVVPISDFSKTYDFDMTQEIKDTLEKYSNYDRHNFYSFLSALDGISFVEGYFIYPINVDTGEPLDLSPYTYTLGFSLTFSTQLNDDAYFYGSSGSDLGLPNLELNFYAIQLFDSLNSYFNTELKLLYDYPVPKV